MYPKLKPWQKKKLSSSVELHDYHSPLSFAISELERRDQTLESRLLTPPTNHPKQYVE